MIEIDHRSKGPEAMAVDRSVGGQASHCPRLERVLGERRHRLEDGVTGVTGVIGVDRADKWALVFGTATRLGDELFVSQIGLSNLDNSIPNQVCFSNRHGIPSTGIVAPSDR